MKNEISEAARRMSKVQASVAKAEFIYTQAQVILVIIWALFMTERIVKFYF